MYLVPGVYLVPGGVLNPGRVSAWGVPAGGRMGGVSAQGACLPGGVPAQVLPPL